MLEMEMTTDVETEIKEFADELSDEALDREEAGRKDFGACVYPCRAGN